MTSYCGFVCISLIISDVQQLLCIYWPYVYILWKKNVWFSSATILKVYLFVYLQLSCLSSLHILDIATAIAAKSLQSCPTLCDPIDGSPPGFPVPGILQARILEWVAISFSNAWRWKVKVKSLSPVRLWATPWTAAYRAPPSMGFSRQEYWSGVPSPFLILDINPRYMTFKHFLQFSRLIVSFYQKKLFSLMQSYLNFFQKLDNFIFSFLNYESKITHLQETWKKQNKLTYSSTLHYSYY